MKRLIWSRGYDWISRIGKKSGYDYTVKDRRIAAMAFEAGWKAAKRDAEKKVGDELLGIRQSLQQVNKVIVECITMLEEAGMGDGDYGYTLLGMCTEACEILKKGSVPVMNQNNNDDELEDDGYVYNRRWVLVCSYALCFAMGMIAGASFFVFL